jgi:hypothetical protein
MLAVDLHPPGLLEQRASSHQKPAQEASIGTRRGSPNRMQS